MNQILLYIAIGIATLIVALLIPGVKVFAEFLLKSMFEGLQELVRHKWSFVVWTVKTLASDHGRLFKHAITSRDVLDPTQKIRRQQKGYDLLEAEDD